jgi:hypothetical protein
MVAQSLRRIEAATAANAKDSVHTLARSHARRILSATGLENFANVRALEKLFPLDLLHSVELLHHCMFKTKFP